MPVSVNVSARQLRQPDFVNIVREAIGPMGADSAGIELEITESVLMDNIKQHLETLKTLRDMGISIAIDDFGTGYSSLAYLARLPVAAMKVDRSFVVSMLKSTETMAIVSTIISLARGLNLKVIAEGVDSVDQLKFLRLLKCDEMQGHLFSKPLPPEKFADLVRSGKRLPPP
jgi:EAL domain-containing protein (putative c-di-GMP-specific phosphodiesterase class I)